jgi:hypothetical protein
MILGGIAQYARHYLNGAIFGWRRLILHGIQMGSPGEEVLYSAPLTFAKPRLVIVLLGSRSGAE